MQLLETIYLENGQCQNIDYHNQRFNETRRAVFVNLQEKNLSDLIKIPEEYKKGNFRCRVIYENEIESINFVEYTQKAIKKLKLIDIGDWDYSHKYADRSFLTQLLQKNPDVDEVMMIKYI